MVSFFSRQNFCSCLYVCVCLCECVCKREVHYSQNRSTYSSWKGLYKIRIEKKSWFKKNANLHLLVLLVCQECLSFTSCRESVLTVCPYMFFSDIHSYSEAGQTLAWLLVICARISQSVTSQHITSPSLWCASGDAGCSAVTVTDITTFDTSPLLPLKIKILLRHDASRRTTRPGCEVSTHKL